VQHLLSSRSGVRGTVIGTLNSGDDCVHDERCVENLMFVSLFISHTIIMVAGFYKVDLLVQVDGFEGARLLAITRQVSNARRRQIGLFGGTIHHSI
jgi:hypothetical protein